MPIPTEPPPRTLNSVALLDEATANSEVVGAEAVEVDTESIEKGEVVPIPTAAPGRCIKEASLVWVEPLLKYTPLRTPRVVEPVPPPAMARAAERVSVPMLPVVAKRLVEEAVPLVKKLLEVAFCRVVEPNTNRSPLLLTEKRLVVAKAAVEEEMAKRRLLVPMLRLAGRAAIVKVA